MAWTRFHLSPMQFTMLERLIHGSLLRSVDIPEIWTGRIEADSARYYSFNGWKVDGCMLRALLIAAYPNLEASAEKQITE